VSQVNKAMARVDQVTQRNASAAEELASTAEEMAAQAQGLEQLVAFFRAAEEPQALRRAFAVEPVAKTSWNNPLVAARAASGRSNGHAAVDPDFRAF
jgi:methyl-accepting chemotaxis protein